MNLWFKEIDRQKRIEGRAKARAKSLVWLCNMMTTEQWKTRVSLELGEQKTIKFRED